MKLLHKLMPLFTLLPFISGCQNKPVEYIGIVSAMDNEIALLLDEMKVEKKETDGSIDYYVGKLRNKDVVVTKSGIGKIRASLGVTTMLNDYNIKEVYFSGIAGGLLDEENVLDIVVADSLVEHDYGRYTNDGFIWTGGDPGMGKDKGEYYYCDPELVELAYNCSVEVMGEVHVFKGTIATGDQFIENEEYCHRLREQFDAYACEMEGASIAVACDKYNIPVVVIRALSDKADGHAHESYSDFGDKAAKNSSQIILKMLESR
ncbi:MAG: 5'-methylthioadenosine/adenosylhomocysteine nucleosidase [Bacilli bacterium]|nr:5'-methylthioadenosine/adenosylhomocysteine nucleosidase [Bacilli bacterium]